MKNFSKVFALVLGSLAMTAHASYTADARSNGMGNTGVVSADFVTAPFHNPALGALYRDTDDFGLVLPAIGAQIDDSDDMLSSVEDIHDVWDSIGNNAPSSEQEAELDRLLDKLSASQPVNAKAGLSASLAIPTRFASMNLFAKGYTEVVSVPEIADTGSTTDRYENSVVGAMAFGVADYGVSLSRNFNIAGQNIAFGISPKMQTFMTYSVRTTLDDFEFEDYDQNEISDSAFNLDLGAAWNYHGFRTGLVVKNVMSQSIDVANYNAKYELDPHAILGVGFVNDYFSVSMDMDLTTQTRFSNTDNDDTQMVRIGLEGNAWDWFQGRVGYEMDLEDNIDGTVTAGIGFSPFSVLHFDVAANYTGENQFGASASLALTF